MDLLIIIHKIVRVIYGDKSDQNGLYTCTTWTGAMSLCWLERIKSSSIFLYSSEFGDTTTISRSLPSILVQAGGG